jgi:hypothetical protein
MISHSKLLLELLLKGAYNAPGLLGNCEAAATEDSNSPEFVGRGLATAP